MISFLHRYLPFITLFLVTIVSTSDYSIYGKSLGELITLQFIIIFAFRLANADANFGKGSLLFFVSIINDALQACNLELVPCFILLFLVLQHIRLELN